MPPRRIPATALPGLVLLLVLGACWPRWQGAEAELGDVRLEMQLRPLAGLHSEWRRRLRVDGPAGAATLPLFEDTGWWRGTSIYRRADGTILLHEGQGGCLVLDPATSARRSGDDLCRAALPRGEPWRRLSEVLPGLTYLGHFSEAGRIGVLWAPAAAGAEPALPPPL